MNLHLPEDLVTQSNALMKDLIKTFDLNPKNVILSPDEWTLMMLYLLRLLEVKVLSQENQRHFLEEQGSHANKGNSLNETTTAVCQDEKVMIHEDMKLRDILNQESIKRLERSFFSDVFDWKQQVELFLCTDT